MYCLVFNHSSHKILHGVVVNVHKSVKDVKRPDICFQHAVSYKVILNLLVILHVP